MKTQTIVLVIFLATSLSLSAQKNTWTIGLYTGVQWQMLQSIEHDYLLESSNGIYVDEWNASLRNIHAFSTIPPMELNVQYNITNNFSVSSGIGFIRYLTLWKSNKSHPLDRFALNTYVSKSGIQIPFALRYSIPIKNTGFSIFPKLGVSLDFIMASNFKFQDNYQDPSQTVSYDDKTYNGVIDIISHNTMNNRKFNLLVNAGLGFAYCFKSGVAISLSGEYNVGTMRVNKLNYRYQLLNPETDVVEYEFDYLISNRNDYWNVLLGVSYTFKNKKKNN